MERRHIDFDCCPECGDDIEADTDAPEGMFTDGDVVRCVSCGCVGQISCDPETDAYVLFD